MSAGVIRWAKGGEARVVSVDARSIVVRSTVPAPPGSRIEGTIDSKGESAGVLSARRPIDGEPFVLLRMKVHSSKRQAAGDFVLEGRPLDLSREARERLEAIVRLESS
jgi:hypothetical protein